MYRDKDQVNYVMMQPSQTRNWFGLSRLQATRLGWAIP